MDAIYYQVSHVEPWVLGMLLYFYLVFLFLPLCLLLVLTRLTVRTRFSDGISDVCVVYGKSVLQ